MRETEYMPDQPLPAEAAELYRTSFPENERIPLERLIAWSGTDRKMFLYYDKEIFIGLSYVFLFEDMVYLGYLAVEEKYRNQGCGSRILKILQERYHDRRILIDIEELDPDAENSLEREKRMDFYIRNGFVSSGVFYWFYDVDYELLSCHGTVKKEDFQRLVRKHWGPASKNAVYREK